MIKDKEDLIEVNHEIFKDIKSVFTQKVFILILKLNIVSKPIMKSTISMKEIDKISKIMSRTKILLFKLLVVQ